MPNDEIKIKQPDVGAVSSKDVPKTKKELFVLIRKLYFIHKWSVDDIAANVNLPKKTIWKYINRIKKISQLMFNKQEQYKNDMLVFLWELKENYKYRVQKLWNDYKKATKEKTKIEILEQLRQEDRQFFDVMTQLGLTPQNVNKAMDNIVYVSFKNEQEETKNETENDNVVVDISNLNKQH